MTLVHWIMYFILGFIIGRLMIRNSELKDELNITGMKLELRDHLEQDTVRLSTRKKLDREVDEMLESWKEK